MIPLRYRLAALGAGNRTQVYAALAARLSERYEFVAVADRHAARRTLVSRLFPERRVAEFTDAASLLAQPRMADILIVATPDSAHFDQARQALALGYDLLLEKPIATNPNATLELARLARELGRRVLVCHVLRYTPYFRQIQSLLTGGAIGQLVNFEATQGLDPWHQAHSYVRGHWGVAETCTPLTVANSCHDFDILSWLVDAPCDTVASSGSLLHFHSQNAPAGAPARCTDGCPVGSTCAYNALRYLTDRRNWLGTVYEHAATATDVEINDWLRTSKWGRCVYRCDNTTVDHQSTALAFANGVTGTFTVTAFSSGRDLALFGTEGRILAGARTRQTVGCDILLERFDGRPAEKINVNAPDEWHRDADAGMMHDMYFEMQKPDPAAMLTSLERSIESHLIGFAAEESRSTGRIVDLAARRKS